MVGGIKTIRKNNEDPANPVIIIEDDEDSEETVSIGPEPQMEEEEEETICGICMDDAVEPMIYTCCKKMVCKECYKTNHRKHKRSDCPFCRGEHTRALPRGEIGIQKKRMHRGVHRLLSEPEFMIARHSILPIIREMLRREGATYRVQEGALYLIRRSTENEVIRLMTHSQHVATLHGNNTVSHLV